MNDVTYRSRVDAWLMVVVAATLGLVLMQTVLAWRESPAEGLPGLLLLVFMIVLTWLLGYPCEYTLTSTHLLIRFGVVRRSIAYAEITSIEPNRSLWSAPALSLQRVKISCAGRFQLVSPVDRGQFIDQLRGRVAAVRAPRAAID